MTRILTINEIMTTQPCFPWTRERVTDLYNTAPQPVTVRVLARFDGVPWRGRRRTLIYLLPVNQIAIFAVWCAERAKECLGNLDGLRVEEYVRMLVNHANKDAWEACQYAEWAATDRYESDADHRAGIATWAISAADNTIQAHAIVAYNLALAGTIASERQAWCDNDAAIRAERQHQLDKLVEMLEEVP
jgi:hypothetical protein